MTYIVNTDDQSEVQEQECYYPLAKQVVCSLSIEAKWKFSGVVVNAVSGSLNWFQTSNLIVSLKFPGNSYKVHIYAYVHKCIYSRTKQESHKPMLEHHSSLLNCSLLQEIKGAKKPTYI